ncbi:hypothetical protein AB0J81_28880 [Streptomyces bobili]|uniref:hypothetical protein n=1 Tax=Streptomyces bobili TaxID=67280 RepID=UPI003422A5E7
MDPRARTWRRAAAAMGDVGVLVETCPQKADDVIVHPGGSLSTPGPAAARVSGTPRSARSGPGTNRLSR